MTTQEKKINVLITNNIISMETANSLRTLSAKDADKGACIVENLIEHIEQVLTCDTQKLNAQPTVTKDTIQELLTDEELRFFNDELFYDEYQASLKKNQNGSYQDRVIFALMVGTKAIESANQLSVSEFMDTYHDSYPTVIAAIDRELPF